MGKRPELVIETGELAGKVFEVKEGGLRLGRSSSNDIHVPDEELSRNHCFFETVGEDGLRLTDLASANGTYVNGESLGGEPRMLKPGDRVEVGKTVVRVRGEEPPTPPPASVDLGLGAGTAETAKPSSAPSRRSPVLMILRLVALALVGVAAYLYFVRSMPQKEASPKSLGDENPPLVEAWYEKVDADQNGIFRYEMDLSPDGVLKVTVDDVPREKRHIVKSQQLDATARAEIADILSFKTLRGIDRAYAGSDSEPPKLTSWSLRVVYATRARQIKIVNTPEPEAFRTVREKLEAFSKNQLGIWALQYSREKLIELSKTSLEQAQAKWTDRDVSHGNLFGAVRAYRDALFYLETVDPKPEHAVIARQGLDVALKELEARYVDQRFLVDRAINLAQWESAQRELGVLLEMIPDRADDRNREATAKLIDVEKRIKGEK